MEHTDNDRVSMEGRILEEAQKLFLEVGYAMSSTTEIARRVGCNQSMVHYYFRTKEQLFLKVFSQMKQLLADSMERTLNDDKHDIFRRIEGIVEVHFDMLLSHQGLPFLVMGQIMTNAERRAELIVDFRPTIMAISTHLQRDLDLAAQRGEITPTDATSLLLNIISLNVGTFMIKPVLCDAMKMTSATWDTFIINRKSEIIKSVLRTLKP